MAECVARLGQTLGVETGPLSPMSWATYLPTTPICGTRIVAKYCLRRLSRANWSSRDQPADSAFAYGARKDPPGLVSTIKLCARPGSRDIRH